MQRQGVQTQATKLKSMSKNTGLVDRWDTNEPTKSEEKTGLKKEVWSEMWNMRI